MTRHAFTMKLKPGCLDEYRRRHDAIWPDLADELRRADVGDYSIFVAEDGVTLFAFQKVSDPAGAAALPRSDVVRRWWAFMADLMDTHPDSSPVCRPLQEVFHLD